MKPLKRHPALIELSREHRGSLSLYVHLLRTPNQSHQAELGPHLVKLEPHFLEEETMFAPYWDRTDPALQQRLEDDHTELRVIVVHPEYVDELWDREFAMTSCDRAHFKERKLFPAIKPFLPLSGNV